MVDLARQIGAAHDGRCRQKATPRCEPCSIELSKDYPKSDTEMIAWYRDAAFRVVDYARKTGIFDVPADYKLEVVETPPPLRGFDRRRGILSGATVQEHRCRALLRDPDRQRSRRRCKANNRAALADLSAHEGFPGHDWHYKVMTGYP